MSLPFSSALARSLAGQVERAGWTISVRKLESPELTHDRRRLPEQLPGVMLWAKHPERSSDVAVVVRGREPHATEIQAVVMIAGKLGVTLCMAEATAPHRRKAAVQFKPALAHLAADPGRYLGAGTATRICRHPFH